MERFACQYGYLGVFLISLIGASSIIIPVPYMVVLYVLGGFLDPFLIAIAGGMGSAVGELSGYIVGYYGRAVVSEERQRKLEFILKIFKGYVPAAIFVFALTPLPDDLLFIPLGILHYSLVGALVPCVLGKVLMCFVVAMGGRLSITFIKDLFGEAGWLSVVVTTALLIVIILVMIKIDWEKIFTKYIERRQKSQ